MNIKIMKMLKELGFINFTSKTKKKNITPLFSGMFVWGGIPTSLEAQNISTNVPLYICLLRRWPA
jgi:hypothetical protein